MRALVVLVGLLLSTSHESDDASPSPQESGVEKSGPAETVVWEYSANGLRVVRRAPVGFAEAPWSRERAWRLDRLDAAGELVDRWWLDSALTVRVPPGFGDTPVIHRPTGAFMVRWARHPRVRRIELWARAGSLAADHPARAGFEATEWVRLAVHPW